ncbi:hypothetical protein BDY19DRAFT_477486 [Irpex rosettiformis]|uniref:Uncharacterized protein n=1 Tax=Irpex rosettiformis TaxID=378272 RepID=A0ACB8TS93_9APHY|nr:hypothetical protein BDY19DRAFT_477486 [Irpex rosettiformis]
MFSAKSMKHPHPTRLTSTLGKVLRFGFGARVKLGDGPFNEESSGRNNNDTGSEEKKVAGEKQEDKVPIVGNKRPLSDNEKALGGESDPHPLPPLPYHPERSDTQESEERPIVAAQVQDHDPVEHLPPEYEHAVHDKPESVVEDAQVEPTQEEAPEQEDRSPSPVEYFEARAAYDFVDDEEPLEEYDGDSPTSSPLNRSSRRVSGTRVITGEGTIDEDGEGDEAYDAGESDMEWDDDRIYEARFRLTPCVEFEEGDEDEGEDIVVGETANMGVDKEAEAELEEAWLAVLGEQRRIANERERQALTEGGQVVVHAQAQATEKTKKRDRELKAGEKAEHMPMSAAVQSSDISLGPSPLSTPPYVDPPQNEEAQAVAQPVEEAMSAAKERKTEEREMTPEEEASLVAHWERQRVVYERVSAFDILSLSTRVCPTVSS